MNAVGFILVIEGTMFIGVSALTTEQLTAPIGLLGLLLQTICLRWPGENQSKPDRVWVCCSSFIDFIYGGE